METAIAQAKQLLLSRGHGRIHVLDDNSISIKWKPNAILRLRFGWANGYRIIIELC